jgi:hypothetical protein
MCEKQGHSCEYPNVSGTLVKIESLIVFGALLNLVKSVENR